jgi:hypothetical protein
MEYSVSIYKSKKGSLLLIPNGFDKHGIRRALDVFIKKEQPYDIEDLGQTLRELFNLSKDTPVIEDVKVLGRVFEIATGLKGWARFSKEHLCVGAGWNPEKGYQFIPRKRVKGGGYLSEKGDPVIKLGLGSIDEEIGKAVLEAFAYLE